MCNVGIPRCLDFRFHVAMKKRFWALPHHPTNRKWFSLDPWKTKKRFFSYFLTEKHSTKLWKSDTRKNWSLSCGASRRGILGVIQTCSSCYQNLKCIMACGLCSLICKWGWKTFFFFVFVFLVSMRYITILPGYVVACGKENDIMFIWKKFKIENYSMFLFKKNLHISWNAVSKQTSKISRFACFSFLVMKLYLGHVCIVVLSV